MELIIGQLLSGLMRSSLLFMVTAGLTLLYGVMGTMNMAHFSFYMIAAYVTWTFWHLFGGSSYAFWISIVISGLAMIGIAGLVERLVMRRIYNRILPQQLLATFALTYIFSDLVKIIWGLEFKNIGKRGILAGYVSVGGIPFPISNLFVILLGLVIIFAIWFTLYKTKFGRIVRACHSHKEIVGALGIRVPMVYSIVFAISGLLAGLAGSAWTAIGSINLGVEQSLLVDAFCVMVIGGMGSFVGTAVASLIVGLAYSFAILAVPRMATLFIFIITGLFLIFRPWGLFGTKGRLH
jgi:branched-chain amino acid transport system permease protein